MINNCVFSFINPPFFLRSARAPQVGTMNEGLKLIFRSLASDAVVVVLAIIQSFTSSVTSRFVLCKLKTLTRRQTSTANDVNKRWWG